MKDIVKIRRGMVFWFDVDPDKNKRGKNTIISCGKELPDHRQYGRRPWLVVSNDTNNCFSGICNVVPISTSDTKANIPTHTMYTADDVKQVVICEQVMTINIAQLRMQDYMYTMSDEIMDNVDRCIAIQLGLYCDNKSKYFADEDRTLDKLDEIIEGIISKRLNDMRRKQEEVNVTKIVSSVSKRLDDALRFTDKVPEVVSDVEESSDKSVELRNIYEGNEDSTRLSQIDKFNKRYKRTNNPKENKRQNKSWSDDEAYRFLRDCRELDVDTVCKKWGMDKSKLAKTKYYLQNRQKNKKK